MRNQSQKPLECIENPQFKLGFDFCLGKLKKGEREAKIVCVGLVFRTVGGSGTDDCVRECRRRKTLVTVRLCSFSARRVLFYVIYRVASEPLISVRHLVEV